MRPNLSKAGLLLIFLFVISIGYQPAPSAAATTAAPSVDFSVQPSATSYILPAGGKANGNLNVSIFPKGMATNEQRQPIAVYFVEDTSGSMSDVYNGARKDTTAKNALSQALNYFSQNSQPLDQYTFIPFDSTISDKFYSYCTGNYWFGGCQLGEVKPATGITNIQTMINGLDSVSYGGTNYSQPLDLISSSTSTSANTKKYIIFLTDGEPTSLQRNETITYNKNTYTNTPVTYTLYSNNTASEVAVINNKNTTLSTDYNYIQSVIDSQALASADNLAANKITMYSFALAQKGDVNFQLLDNMSKKTGGYAVPGDPSNLSSLFADITSKFTAPSISGEVTIDLSKYKNTVQVVPGSDAYIDSNNVAHINFNFSYPINKSPTPNEIDDSLPLTFSSTGTYTFDNIKLNYTDLNGNQVTKSQSPITVNVTNDMAATFNSTVSLNTVHNPPESLIKQGTTDSELNQFQVEYSITPTGLVNTAAAGNLNTFTMIQPLPAGISLASSQLTIKSGNSFLGSATANQISTASGQAVQITIPSTIGYKNGSFDLTNFTFDVTLKADWAQSSTTIPNSTMTYSDSRFGQQTITLSGPPSKVNMKVNINDSNFCYTGDYSGALQKISTTNSNGYTIGQIVSETQASDANLPAKPIMGMTLVNGQKIQITYNDQSTGYLYLRPDFQLNETPTGKILANGDTTAGPVSFKVTNLVGGKNVVYEYSITSDTGSTSWTAFDPSGTISIPSGYLGNVKVDIRATGGFSPDQTPVEKSIVIQRLVSSISVSPNPISLLAGSSLGFTVTVSPSDALNKTLNYSIQNPAGQTVATLVNNNTILGQSAGTATLIIKSVDGSNIQVSVPITVQNPYIALTGMQFTQPKYTLNVGDTLELNPSIIFNPSNATNKNLKSVTATNNSVVTIVQRTDGTWYLKALQSGYSTIKAISSDNANLSDTAVIQVNPAGSSGGGGSSGSSTDGKW
ncbi:Ig-like domain-containing protein [Heyndrickxia acidicola]|uniref:VWA domain-containing protein n=1 Tax=Heyndrickxia acidicola TaxID=209389 RepID=A0ABU6MNL5_9BACI|nr:Ig-like domain-containing protein [Heyndrickxia acidicola]MED1204812.1 VWA domain-containing protein [Heyndrickxia acidicola]